MIARNARQTRAAMYPAIGLTDPVIADLQSVHQILHQKGLVHTPVIPAHRRQSTPALISVELTHSQMSLVEGCLALLYLTKVSVHPMSQALAAKTLHYPV